MIECPHCHYEWKVRYLVAKGLSRCPRCQTELDLSTFLLDQIGGTLAIKKVRQEMARRN